MEHENKKPASLERDDRDVDVRSIVKLGLLLAALTAATLGIAWVLVGSLTREEQAGHTEPPPIAAGRATAPAEPRLSPSPPKKLEALRDEEKQILEAYDWEDADRGVVRIPITEAINLLAKRGLPSRAKGPAPASISHPTQSSLGEPRGER
jgi:hypothetical protein